RPPPSPSPRPSLDALPISADYRPGSALTAAIRSAVPGWVARKPPLLPPVVCISQLSVSAIICLPGYPARCRSWTPCGDDDPPPDDDVADVGPAHAKARVAKTVRAAIRAGRLMSAAPEVSRGSR